MGPKGNGWSDRGGRKHAGAKRSRVEGHPWVREGRVALGVRLVPGMAASLRQGEDLRAYSDRNGGTNIDLPEGTSRGVYLPVERGAWGSSPGTMVGPVVP